MTLEVLHFGCRLNAAEGERMLRSLSNKGLTNTIIFNGCAVTQEAERKLQKLIRRKRRENANARLILTGCPASIRHDFYKNMPELDDVVDNADKIAWAEREGQKSLQRNQGNIPAQKTIPNQRTRLFLPIQNGCDHACTFCVIPQGRGANRSVPIAEIDTHLNAAGDVKEVVLTGVDITAYGNDTADDMNLGRLVQELLRRHPHIPRWRLTSLDSAEVDSILLELFATEPRLMPHLHLSVQSGADLILKRMRRRHLRHDILNLANEFRQRRPDIVFGADFIVGFPTESDDHFRDTQDLIDQAGIDWLHVFPYSKRPGTPASRMPQLAPDLILTRARSLRRHATERGNKLAQLYLDSHQSVLFERDGRGYTPHYIPVKFTGPDIPEPGSIHTVSMTKWDADRQIMECQ